jgi:hypothetical protein
MAANTSVLRVNALKAAARQDTPVAQNQGMKPAMDWMMTAMEKLMKETLVVVFHAEVAMASATQEQRDVSMEELFAKGQANHSRKFAMVSIMTVTVKLTKITLVAAPPVVLKQGNVPLELFNVSQGLFNAKAQLDLHQNYVMDLTMIVMVL